MSRSEPYSSEHHLRQLQWQIGRMYMDHRLLDEQYWNDGRGARWLIGQPGTNIMLTEIIAGVCGSLVVHGDCDLSRFAYYSDRADAWSRLGWMAFCADVGYYVNQKHSIGMSRSGNPEAEYDEEVARYDIIALIKELRASGESHECIAYLRGALSHTENHHELYDYLYRKDKFCLYEYNFGRVMPTPAIAGHLALQRCAYLLLDKYGEDGPPACHRRAEAA